VLVRHQNGFVTAYAHASELNVKKGDSVKRGQVIGKAGATGNVTSPQLHFEVRRGACSEKIPLARPFQNSQACHPRESVWSREIGWMESV